MLILCMIYYTKNSIKFSCVNSVYYYYHSIGYYNTSIIFCIM